MRRAYDVASVRAAEAKLIAEVGDLALMRRAAHGLALTCVRMLDRCYGSRVTLLVGSGNNGGDTLFAGAELAQRGVAVTAVRTGSHTHPAGSDALRGAGGRIVDADDRRAETAVAGADLLVDGVVGIGGRGTLASRPAHLLEVVAAAGVLVVAVDVPSGVDSDTGAVEGDAVWADVTVTFGALKTGLVVAPGALHCGLVELVDIGLGPSLVSGPPAVELLDADDVAALLPEPTAASDKYSQGVPGIVAGSSRYPGAAVLATGAALHAKAGLVRYAGPAADQVVARWPSAVVVDGPPGSAGQVQAWGIGPGIGTDDAAAGRVLDVLGANVAVVVDADALTVVAGDPALRDRIRARSAATVLTPHDGEFARLAPDLALDPDRVGATSALAQRLQATVLRKGMTTIVATPGRVTLVNPTGTAWLANAGTGDVLTGIITAYLAAGLDPHLAVGAAAFVHGLAGHLAGAGDDQPMTADQLVDALAPTYELIRRR